MSNIVGATTGSTNVYDSATLMALASGTLGSHNATQFTLTAPDGTVVTGHGTGLSYSGGHPSGGTLTSLTIQQGTATTTWSSFSVAVGTLWTAIASGDVTTFENLFFSGDDTFTSGLSGPGGDVFNGYAGNDTFNYTGNFSVLSNIDGGAGTDTLNLNGDYSSGLTLFPQTLQNVEILNVQGAHNYKITTNDANIAAGATLTVNATSLAAGSSLVLDGSAETDGGFIVNGGPGNVTFKSGHGNDTFNGGSGQDTIDYSGATSGITVDLSNSGPQAIGAGEGTDTLVNVDNIIGSNFTDTLTGNSADNTFYITNPNSTINGGAGNDTVSFQNSFGPVTIDLSTQANFTSIENITGSNSGGDILSGTSGNNVISTGGGQDTVLLTAATGNVTIDMTGANTTTSGAGIGTDTLIGSFNFTGSNFDDTLIVGTKQNLGFNFDGGAGNNTVDFSNAVGPVTADGNGQFYGPYSGQLTSVQNLIGSAYDDTLFGTGTLIGGAGNDTLFNGTVMDGGPGDDIFWGSGAPGTQVDGGTGNNTLHLGSGTIVLGPDSVKNVQTFMLSDAMATDLVMNDATVPAGQTLTIAFDPDPGNRSTYPGDFTFDGSAETDGNFNITCENQPGWVSGGNDTIDGGAGTDTAIFSGQSSAYTISTLNAVTTISGPDGTDTLRNVEKLQFADTTITLPPYTPQYDFNGDGKSDILFQSASTGQPAIWEMNGSNIVSGSSLFNPGTAWHAISAGDFGADGYADMLWQSTDGSVAVWLMNGLQFEWGGTVFNPGPSWHAIGTGDFNGDGKADILLQNDSGQAAIWEMNNYLITNASGLFNPGPSWHIKGSGDFNGDGKSDIVWQNTDGTVAIWEMNGLSTIAAGTVFNPGPSWHVVATGDFNGDLKSDIVLQNDNGQVAIWEMNGMSIMASGRVGANPGTDWHVISAGDFNNDGNADLLWQNSTTGQPMTWEMNGLSFVSSKNLFNPGTDWHVVTG